MGFYRLINFFLLCLITSAYAEFPEEIKNNILIRIAGKQSTEALKYYFDYYENTRTHDLNLLSSIAEHILIQGYDNSDEYIQKTCILGASQCESSQTMKILINGIKSPDPNIQLLTINSLNHCGNQTTRDILFKAMSSDFLIIRLEAAYKLALLQETQVLDYLHSTIPLLPEIIKNQLNKIFIHLDHEEAHGYVRQYFGNKDVITRSETAFLSGVLRKNIFLPQLRTLVTGIHPIEQEVSLFSLGELHDGESYSTIKKFLTSPNSSLSIAAAIALSKLGKEEEGKKVLINHIHNHNLMAISALKEFSSLSAQEILIPLMSDFSENEKFNACYILLQHGFFNEESLSTINRFLLSKETRDTLSLIISPGKTIVSVIVNDRLPHQNTHTKKISIAYLKEHLLDLIFMLPGNAFIDTSKALLKSKHRYLLPRILLLLTKKNTNQVQELLTESTQSLGAPLIRIYATLSLYKMTGDPNYKQELLEWLEASAKETLIILEKKDNNNALTPYQHSYFSYSLNLEEKTRLFMDILATLIQNKENEDIATLIKVILNGHPKNLYFLTSLLFKSSE